MISFDIAFQKVQQHLQDWGKESMPFLDSMGRVLAEDILADRDFPPFDRSTRDGIALQFSAVEKGVSSFRVEGTQSAGAPRKELGSPEGCLEVMTGAVIPKGTDTVVMYEKVGLEDGVAQINEVPKPGQNIHSQGSDVKKGATVVQSGLKITAAEIGILATVGKKEVVVKRLPRVCVISTGNELVEVSEIPLPHQIRKSNSFSLHAALSKETIIPKLLHLRDEKETIKSHLSEALESNDVLLLSGGVSKGKFDFIPEVLASLGVQKVFHRVAQRPGKPFWFGVQPQDGTMVFSFPGNPVSTFANFHIYFLPWLYRSLGLHNQEREVILEAPIDNPTPLTLFVQVKARSHRGCFYASPIQDGGSGDLASLSRSNGFVCLRPKNEPYLQGETVPFIQT